MIEQAAAEAEAHFGRIDVLVNNAGYGYLAAIEEGEDEAVRKQFETNVFGLIAMTRRVLPGMRVRRRGHIVNLGHGVLPETPLESIDALLEVVHAEGAPARRAVAAPAS